MVCNPTSLSGFDKIITNHLDCNPFCNLEIFTKIKPPISKTKPIIEPLNNKSTSMKLLCVRNAPIALRITISDPNPKNIIPTK